MTKIEAKLIDKAVEESNKTIAIGFHKWLSGATYGKVYDDQLKDYVFVFTDKALGMLDYQIRYTYDMLYELYLKTLK